MKVTSFIRVGAELEPVVVELTLAPGLPQFHFIGLPDAALKESALRIRTAIREQGFQLPQAHQILVNLTPTHLRKSSRGMDLAIAAALLWETEQIPRPEEAMPILYGELTLKGEVTAPSDIDELDGGLRVVTGVHEDPLSVATWRLPELRSLAVTPEWVSADGAIEWRRPATTITELSSSAAELAAVVAVGEHSLLLAGPPGSGKSTLASAIPTWLEEPGSSEFRATRKYWRRAGLELTWRPVLRPHHSITPLAMIGGGTSLWPGEITRAHGGVLIMDELLEFHHVIQESLREPVESGVISLVRAGGVRTYPARILLLATTNLCQCGKFVLEGNMGGCRCVKYVRRRYLTRLTGPFVDRFALFATTENWVKEKNVSVVGIESRVRDAIAFRREARGQTVPNARVEADLIESSLTKFQSKHLLESGMHSRRRREAVLRVARTLADLRLDSSIENQDIDAALRLSVRTHRSLEDWVE